MRLWAVLLLAVVWATLILPTLSSDGDGSSGSSNGDEWEGLEDEVAFNKWSQKYGRLYQTDQERNQRFLVWQNNRAHVHNFGGGGGGAATATNQRSYTIGLNNYADLTFDEFARMLHNIRPPSPPPPPPPSTRLPAATRLALPETVDWRDSGVVTPVASQGTCGACWAFAVLGSVETAAAAAAAAAVIDLSEQFLLDCCDAATYGTDGCNGGTLDGAMRCIHDYGGVPVAASYRPYNQSAGACSLDPETPRYGAVATAMQVTPGSEYALTYAISQHGPVVVSFDGMDQDFQLYVSGIYDNPLCSASSPNHGLLAIGYNDSVPNAHYYILRNSWGTAWGMDGYMHVAKDQNNFCGITNGAIYPSFTPTTSTTPPTATAVPTTAAPARTTMLINLVIILMHWSLRFKYY